MCSFDLRLNRPTCRAAEQERLERKQAKAKIVAMELRRVEMTLQVKNKVRQPPCVRSVAFRRPILLLLRLSSDTIAINA